MDISTSPQNHKHENPLVFREPRFQITREFWRRVCVRGLWPFPFWEWSLTIDLQTLPPNGQTRSIPDSPTRAGSIGTIPMDSHLRKLSRDMDGNALLSMDIRRYSRISLYTHAQSSAAIMTFYVLWHCFCISCVSWLQENGNSWLIGSSCIFALSITLIALPPTQVGPSSNSLPDQCYD